MLFITLLRSRIPGARAPGPAFIFESNSLEGAACESLFIKQPAELPDGAGLRAEKSQLVGAAYNTLNPREAGGFPPSRPPIFLAGKTEH